MFSWISNTLPSDTGLEVLFENLPQVATAIAMKKAGVGKISDPANKAIHQVTMMNPLNESFEDQEKKGKSIGTLGLNGAIYARSKGQEYADSLITTVVGGVEKSIAKHPKIQNGLSTLVKNLSIF
jgi:hypothetical protein